MKKPQFVIAAPTSNGGKTTLTLGLLRALKKRGHRIQPFKVGPDYIDPKFHQVACAEESINLDLFMMSEEEMRESYAAYTQQADITCVEGVMGLFDGARKDQGSTAELAIKLDLPVIFVVNAKATAYSVAPLIQGFASFHPQLRIAGVIFNHVNRPTHYQLLKEACMDINIPALGYLPTLEDCSIPSRHLGLSIEAIQDYSSTIDKIAYHLEQTVDLNQLLDCCQIEIPAFDRKVQQQASQGLRIAVARDAAFNFCYTKNIEALKQIGALSFFSPLDDNTLPQADFVYIPGGYPECYLDALAANKSLLTAIATYAKNGGAIWAECGGMMYLGKAIRNKAGTDYPMVGIFDFVTSMAEMKLHLGYRTVEIEDKVFKGHEFHYSSISQEQNCQRIGIQKNARNKAVDTAVYKQGNVCASYTHLYFGNKQLVQQLLKLINQPKCPI